MVRKITIPIFILLLALTFGINIYAQEVEQYKGYSFTEDASETIKVKLKKVIDNIIEKKAELYLLEEDAKELKSKADRYVDEGRNDEVSELYIQYNHITQDKIYPLKWEIEDLSNLDDYTFVMYVKSVDEEQEKEEILKVVKNLNEDTNNMLNEAEKISNEIKSSIDTSNIKMKSTISEKREQYIQNCINFYNMKEIPLEAFTQDVIIAYNTIFELEDQLNDLNNELFAQFNDPEEFYAEYLKSEEIQTILAKIRTINESPAMKNFKAEYNNLNYNFYAIPYVVISLM